MMPNSGFGFVAINRQTPPILSPISHATPLPAVHEESTPAGRALISNHLGLGQNQITASLDGLPRDTRRIRKARAKTTIAQHTMLPNTENAQAESRNPLMQTPTSHPPPAKRQRSNQSNGFQSFPVSKPGVRFDRSTKGETCSNASAALLYGTPEPSLNPPQPPYGHQIADDSSPGVWAPSDMENLRDNRPGLPLPFGGEGDTIHHNETGFGFEKLDNIFNSDVQTRPLFNAKSSSDQEELQDDGVVWAGDSSETVAPSFERELDAEMYQLDEDFYIRVNYYGNSSDWPQPEEMSGYGGDDLEDELADEALMSLLPNEVQDLPVTNDDWVPKSSSGFFHDNISEVAGMDDDWDLDESEEADLTKLSELLTPLASSTRTSKRPSEIKIYEDRVREQQDLSPREDLTTSPDNPISATAIDFGLSPIVRPPFPARTRDRSPITGLTSDTSLRVCFRVGEALNTGCNAVRHGYNVIIELYARVMSTDRDTASNIQTFVFGDLFHNRPPFIHGVYEGWKGVDPWDYDSAVFLEQSNGADRLCRCMGYMKREKNAWKLTILNIWEAAWEDVEYVKGIICS